MVRDFEIILLSMIVEKEDKGNGAGSSGEIDSLDIGGQAPGEGELVREGDSKAVSVNM